MNNRIFVGSISRPRIERVEKAFGFGTANENEQTVWNESINSRHTMITSGRLPSIRLNRISSRAVVSRNSLSGFEQCTAIASLDDMTIKMWDWDAKWALKQTFEGHIHYVMQIAINPKDNNTFASASLDRTVKVPTPLSVPMFPSEPSRSGN
jgi:WD40 repeat protein